MKYLFILFFSSTLFAIDFYVSKTGSNIPPYNSWANASTNIQEALDEAIAGDTVWVSNGIYLLDEKITVSSGIFLKSINGPQNTIVDANKQDRCFYLYDNAVIHGFTITNGQTGTDGGGIYCLNNTIISNCVISGNSAGDSSYDYGGGIYCPDGNSCIILSCIIKGNSAGDAGGGICCFDNCIISNNVITGNTSGDNGGGIYCEDNNIIKNCVINGNFADDSGGGIFSKDDNIIDDCIANENKARDGGGIYSYKNNKINNCIFNNNLATKDYGGLYCRNDTIVTDCIINNNFAEDDYGGLYCDDASIINCYINNNSANDRTGGVYCNDSTLKNCIIAENYSGNYGGGLYLGGGVARNCTITGNTSLNQGGGVYFRRGLLQNSIVYFNTAPTAANYYNLSTNNYYKNCCVYPYITDEANVDACITSAPGFIDRQNGKYQLFSDSPCINAGSISNVTILIDIAGNPRIVDYQIDIGAYESNPADFFIIITSKQSYVSHEITNYCVAGISTTNILVEMVASNETTGIAYNFEGTNIWNSPVIDLIAGVNTIRVSSIASSDSDVISIMCYTSKNLTNFVSGFGSHEWPFISWETAANNIQDACDAAQLGKLVLVTNGIYYPSETISVSTGITVKSINGAEATIIDGRNSRQCVYLDSYCVIDGFNIRNGTATSGGGLYCYDYNGVYNCSINGNNAIADGGGIYSDSRCIISNCVIFGNSSGNRGGGVHGELKDQIYDCVIFNNSASFGGGLYNWNADIRNIVVTNNWASYRGGGIYSDAFGTIAKSLICDNVSSNYGGGIYSDSGGMVVNSIIRNNFANYAGGIYYNIKGTFKNSTIIYNSATEVGGAYYDRVDFINSIIALNSGIDVAFATTGTVRNCCIDFGFDYPGNISENPMVMPDGKLMATSPCIDAGTNLTDVLFDFFGTPRPQGTAYDIGANEWFPEPWISGWKIEPSENYLERDILNDVWLVCENLWTTDLHNAKISVLDIDIGRLMGTNISYCGTIEKNVAITGMWQFPIYIPITDYENAVLTVAIEADEGVWTNNVAVPIIPEPFGFLIFNFIFLILRKKLI